ncbi:MAG: gliding motility-associated C-terminal domain-containing protein [Bacteroidia bacterium]
MNSTHKYILAITIYLLPLASFVNAQNNLVPNWSFENIVKCPNYIANGSSPGDTTGIYATPWQNGNDGTIDLYSSCDTLIPPWFGWTYPEYGTPKNVNGDQLPRTGNNYLGMCVYADQTTSQHYPPSREYPEVKLIDSLKAAKKYCASFYVSPADSTCYYSTSRMGCYISKGSVGNDTTHLINVSPQIENPYHNFLNNYTGWTAIQGIYTATGGENYITIGNFYSDANTDTLPIHLNHYAERIYYYIDDVSVVEYSAANAGNDTNVCKGANVVLGANSTFGASYAWYLPNGDTISNGGNIIATPTVATTYVLQKQQCGIYSYDTVTVQIKPSNTANAGKDTTICIGGSALIGTSILCTWCTYNWQPAQNQSSQVLVYPLVSTTYSLSLKDSCFTTYSNITVNVDYCQSPVVTVPNIFTPNGDGINDTWQPIIQNPLSLLNYQCTMYDRWGTKVFDVGMLANAWDGHTTSGLACTEGTYYYVLSYTDAKTNEQKQLKGFLELVR